MYLNSLLHNFFCSFISCILVRTEKDLKNVQVCFRNWLCRYVFFLVFSQCNIPNSSNLWWFSWDIFVSYVLYSYLSFLIYPAIRHLSFGFHCMHHYFFWWTVYLFICGSLNNGRLIETFNNSTVLCENIMKVYQISI